MACTVADAVLVSGDEVNEMVFEASLLQALAATVVAPAEVSLQLVRAS
jgi:hypothetical protein